MLRPRTTYLINESDQMDSANGITNDTLVNPVAVHLQGRYIEAQVHHVIQEDVPRSRGAKVNRGELGCGVFEALRSFSKLFDCSRWRCF